MIEKLAVAALIGVAIVAQPTVETVAVCLLLVAVFKQSGTDSTPHVESEGPQP